VLATIVIGALAVVGPRDLAGPTEVASLDLSE
jgi:hypothetical protein